LRLPDRSVLVVSGCGAALLAQRAVVAGATRVLVKSPRRTELSRALAELLC